MHQPISCFVLMPFDETFEYIYSSVVRPTLESEPLQLLCRRADEIFDTSVIIDDIFAEIDRSEILVADLTNKNPNVLYELGYAHAMGKRVLLLTQAIDDVPFDLRHLRIIEYADDAKGLHDLKISLVNTIQTVVTNFNATGGDPPEDFLTLSDEMKKLMIELQETEKRMDAQKAALCFLGTVGRTVESIKTYKELRDVCFEKSKGPRWHISLDFLRALPELPSENVTKNIVVPLAFIGQHHEQSQARAIIVRAGFKGPFEIPTDVIKDEISFRKRIIENTKKEEMQLQQTNVENL